MTSFLGGIDSGSSPALVRPDRVSRATNLTFRGGRIGIRPGYDRLTLTFSNEDVAAFFRANKLQGAAAYQTRRGSYVIVVVAGRVFEIGFESPEFGAVREVSPAGVANNADARQAWLCQAGGFMVIQDGVSKPIIFDGNASRRAEDNEVPVGTVMAYGLGRLWVYSGGLLFAGDLAGSKTNAEISFTEEQYLTERSGFPFPADLGEVRAMTFPAVQDTSTGQGDLLVLGDYGAVSIAANVPRLFWKDTPGILRVSMRNHGPTGASAYTLVNGDVFFRSFDGVRSYRMAVAEQGGWGQVPLSNEMKAYFEDDSLELIQYARTATFDNRLLITCGPQIAENGGVRHTGFVALDFNTASDLGRRGDPAVEGIWTGPLPTEIVAGQFGGVEQCLVFSLDDDGQNRIYRLTKDAPFDLGDNRIVASFETRAFDYQTPFNEKNLIGGDFWFGAMWGDVDVDVYWKPDEFPAWVKWDNLHECAPFVTTLVAKGDRLRTPRKQHRSRVRLKTPPEVADPITYKLLTRGMTYQLRVVIQGAVEIPKFRVHANKVAEDPSGNEASTVVCQPFDVSDRTDMLMCNDDTSYRLADTPVNGCTNPLALNFNPLATLDDGSCVFASGTTVTYWNEEQTASCPDGMVGSDVTIPAHHYSSVVSQADANAQALAAAEAALICDTCIGAMDWTNVYQIRTSVPVYGYATYFPTGATVSGGSPNAEIPSTGGGAQATVTWNAAPSEDERGQYIIRLQKESGAYKIGAWKWDSTLLVDLAPYTFGSVFNFGDGNISLPGVPDDGGTPVTLADGESMHIVVIRSVIDASCASVTDCAPNSLETNIVGLPSTGWEGIGLYAKIIPPTPTYTGAIQVQMYRPFVGYWENASGVTVGGVLNFTGGSEPNNGIIFLTSGVTSGSVMVRAFPVSTTDYVYGRGFIWAPPAGSTYTQVMGKAWYQSLDMTKPSCPDPI